MAKKRSFYFDEFLAMANYSTEAAEFLQAALANFNPDTLEEARIEMHAIEHAEDVRKHEMMAQLVKEFVTPIDREDIIQLANALDDVTDKIDDILIRLYMYNVREIHPLAHEFGNVILRCCRAMRAAVEELPNFHKSATLKQALIDVNTMEDEGDQLYIASVRELYSQEGNTLEKLVWGELFERLEECCDACENVADLIEMVAMKNA